jgi:ferredoxin-NADP reductase
VSSREGWRELTVAAADRGHDVLHLRLVDPAGAPLPSFTPGAHLVIDAGGHANAYSLTGEFLDPQAYEVSVLRLDDGRGGSLWLHREVGVGDRLLVSQPRSAFPPVATARHHVLIAGGIGITPMLSHVRAALRFGLSFELIYGHRLERPLAGQWLRQVCATRQLHPAAGRVAMVELVWERLAAQPLGTHVYVCGPPAMIDAVHTIASSLGWPAERVHTEAFTSAALEPGEPFDVRLRDSGQRIRVPAGVSLLEALESQGVTVANLCRQGVCGECRVQVTDGLPLHRDLYLSDEERAAGDSVMCCVSRARGAELELAL